MTYLHTLRSRPNSRRVCPPTTAKVLLAEIEKDAKRTHALASQVDRHSGANGAVSTQPLLCLVWLVLGECKDLLIEHDYNWVHTQYAITNK
ncbi:hypothetical protein EB796_005194 [Bugula neritina]|uniref:Uncharacterized protein n=1 Tax=Bugula neritina TaxID=10212 RepID=A0A7J7KE72_BUGNE|nr:hypothetical protein EB796_005194 [Bugula neritina]